MLPKIPGRFYYLFGKPYDTKGKKELLNNRDKANEAYLSIKSEVEKIISYLRTKREEDPYRSIVSRTVYQATWGSSQQIPTFNPWNQWPVHLSSRSFFFLHLILLGVYGRWRWRCNSPWLIWHLLGTSLQLLPDILQICFIHSSEVCCADIFHVPTWWPYLHLWAFVTHRCCKEPIRDWALNSLPDPISFVKVATLQVTLPLATSRDVVCTSRKIHKEKRRQNLHGHPFIRPTIPHFHLIWPVPFVWSSIHEQNLQNP